MSHRPPFMSHLFLSHLSKNNNTPKIVRDLFTGIAGEIEVIIAPRDQETELYHIRDQDKNHVQRMILNRKTLPAQLSLF